MSHHRTTLHVTWYYIPYHTNMVHTSHHSTWHHTSYRTISHCTTTSDCTITSDHTLHHISPSYSAHHSHIPHHSHVSIILKLHSAPPHLATYLNHPSTSQPAHHIPLHSIWYRILPHIAPPHLTAHSIAYHISHCIWIAFQIAHSCILHHILWHTTTVYIPHHTFNLTFITWPYYTTTWW